MHIDKDWYPWYPGFYIELTAERRENPSIFLNESFVSFAASNFAKSRGLAAYPSFECWQNIIIIKNALSSPFATLLSFYLFLRSLLLTFSTRSQGNEWNAVMIYFQVMQGRRLSWKYLCLSVTKYRYNSRSPSLVIFSFSSFTTTAGRQ